jgi:molybdopterin/thiamine biosynthesis adenylyltransferase
MLRINPHQTALWRDLDSLQIGSGEQRVIFNSLTPAQERLITALYRGIADKHLPNLLNDLGVDSAEGQQIVESLTPLLLKDTRPLKDSLTEDFVAGAFAEIIRASLLSAADGATVLMERKFRTVHIDDLSGAGLAIALGLASAGVGRLVTHDQSMVESKDLGPSAYPSQLLGKSKIQAIRNLLASSPNPMKVIAGQSLTSRNLEAIDCAAIISHQAIEPRRYVQWLNRDVPHVSISFETDRASVSPLIVPGRGPCLYCLEQARTDEDPSWPVIASQLVANESRLDDSASRLFCAGLAIQKLLAHLDDIGGFRQTEKELVGYQLHLATGVVSEFRWSEHEACSCRHGSI